MQKSNEPSTRVERTARLRWIPIPKMKVSPVAQRELNHARVNKLAAKFEPEQIGTPTLNERDGHFYIIDGQHRMEVLKEVGWGDQQVQCWTYSGLTETEEAEMFLELNDVLTVAAFDRFRIGVAAGRDVECDIERIVRLQTLVVTRDNLPGAISAVGTLTKVYNRAGGSTLGRTLRIVRDAYGDPGLEAQVIEGIGLLCQRYNGELDNDTATKRLGSAHGGVNGLLGKSEIIRRQTGSARAHCVAAAAVEILNAGRGGCKLPSWWKTESES